MRHGDEALNETLRAKTREARADAVIFVHDGTENVLSRVPFFAAVPYEVLTAGGLTVRLLEAEALQAHAAHAAVL